MSGLLDSKQRVMDTIVTLQGRRQMSNGGMKIAYASFTDSTTFYLADAVSGSQDATNRVYLEASCLPQDMITFEADDSGRLLPFTASTGSFDPAYVVVRGQILSGSGVGGTVPLDDVTFASESQKLTESSLQNFKNLYVIGTSDELLEEMGDRFGLSTVNHTFNVDGSRPIDDQTKHTVNINDRESLFNDPRFSRIPNFKFLPPLRAAPPPELQFAPTIVNEIKSARHIGVRSMPAWRNTSRAQFSQKRTTPLVSTPAIDPSPYLLGQYRPLGSTKGISDAEIMSGLQFFEKHGFRVDVDFDPRPPVNRLVCQFFEKSTGTLLKLDMLDFGKVVLENGQLGDVYFVGKVVTDDNGTHTFIHLFTLVFESYSPSAKQSRAESRMRASTR